jgi:hypothetical protein
MVLFDHPEMNVDMKLLNHKFDCNKNIEFLDTINEIPE